MHAGDWHFVELTRIRRAKMMASSGLPSRRDGALIFSRPNFTHGEMRSRGGMLPRGSL